MEQLSSKDEAEKLGKVMTFFNPLSYVAKQLGCIIISACTSPDSYEVNLARNFRDSYMDERTLTGYYALCPYVAPLIHRNKTVKRIVKRILVDRLVDYGEWRLGIKPEMKFRTSGAVKTLFLGLCQIIGWGVDRILQEA